MIYYDPECPHYYYDHRSPRFIRRIKPVTHIMVNKGWDFQRSEIVIMGLFHAKVRRSFTRYDAALTVKYSHDTRHLAPTRKISAWPCGHTGAILIS